MLLHYLFSILKPIGIKSPKFVYELIEKSDKPEDSITYDQHKIDKFDAAIAGQQAFFEKGKYFYEKGYEC